MTTTENTMAIWDRVCTTDAAYTKEFKRAGGFKGTATNATWLAREATRVFGPCGIGWGFTVADEKYREGANGTVVHVVLLKLWYVLDGKRGELEQFGQTTFVGKNQNGTYTDEEAPKKSITDAMSKCLSLLGFASDVYLGFWDDSKYVAEQKRFAGWSDSLGSDGEPIDREPEKAPEPKREEPTPKVERAQPDPRDRTDEAAMASAMRTGGVRDDALADALEHLALVEDDETMVAWMRTHSALLARADKPAKKATWAAILAMGAKIRLDEAQLKVMFADATKPAEKAA